ncbi:hypothetical protein H072_11346 [Dactylellina haptotyla CBS 200.50]|uniref:Ubiquitin 3 binding protein But2 C-terminal domain-containing protein n=1 Tax=Dactylellina haptotyla (strain CBS 200.50) TaxID=1284197 RepID=S8BJ19_DACHA|nr:hypothetical protein H072_11346 [Dactylellina haptotyla CBS 200.50]
MRFLSSILLFSAASAASAATTLMKCNADNCLRAIRASAFPTRLGTADCSSYFLATVTPDTSTVTVTSTLSLTETLYTFVVPTLTPPPDTITGTEVAKRAVTVVPSSIPSYASACSGAVRYESACSCIGVTRTTVTAAAPLTTVTEVPKITTTLVIPTATVAPFILKMIDGASNSNRGPYVAYSNEENFEHATFTSSKTAAQQFYFNPDTGNLETIGHGRVVSTDTGSPYWVIFSSNSYDPLPCTVDNGFLNCQLGNAVEWGSYANGYALLLGPANTNWGPYVGAKASLQVIYV